MRLTLEKDRERIKRFSHIRAASGWGVARCSVSCPGTSRVCTLKRGHSGPHVAHGWFGRVVAVWDESVGERKPAVRPKRLARKKAIKEPRTAGGFMGLVRAFRKRFLGRPELVEQVIFLVLALSMVGFFIDIALRVLGIK